MENVSERKLCVKESETNFPPEMKAKTEIRWKPETICKFTIDLSDLLIDSRRHRRGSHLISVRKGRLCLSREFPLIFYDKNNLSYLLFVDRSPISYQSFCHFFPYVPTVCRSR